MTRLTPIPRNLELIVVNDGRDSLTDGYGYRQDLARPPQLYSVFVEPETRGRPSVSADECKRRRHVREERLATGCCTRCGASRPPGDPILCKRCRIRDRAYGRTRWDAHRQRVQAAKAMRHGETP